MTGTADREVIPAPPEIAQRLREIAEDRAERIRQAGEDRLTLIADGLEQADWRTLGYASPADWYRAVSDLELTSEEVRERIVSALRNEGYSIRRIAAELDIGKSTVQRQVSQAGTPDPGKVTGQDGKVYPATQPAKADPVGDRYRLMAETGWIPGKGPVKYADMTGEDKKARADWLKVKTVTVGQVKPVTVKPRRRPITEQLRDAVFELQKAADKLKRLTADDRWKPELLDYYQSDLKRAGEIIHAVLVSPISPVLDETVFGPGPDRRPS